MSGHSKWSTIKRQKGAADIKRGQAFTKLSNAITIAIKQGGGVSDPAGNVRLRLAIDSARQSNMPKENIERAIQRALGKLGGDLEEVVYEGFGPGGFSVVVEAATDNKQRTVAVVKNVFDKHGGSLGSPGAVSYQFQQKGMITIAKNTRELDEIFLIAADSGAEDVEDDGNEVIIYTKTDELNKVRTSLQSQGFTIISAELIWRPTITVAVTDPEIARKAVTFMEKLEELEDVQKAYANFDIPESMLQ